MSAERGARDGRRDRVESDLPAPLADALELLAGESAASRAFLGGLALGALVGAALAGGAVARRGGLGLRRRIPKR